MSERLEDLELGAIDIFLEAIGIGHRHPAIHGAPQNQGWRDEPSEWRRIERPLGAGALDSSFAVAGKALQVGGAFHTLGRHHRRIGVSLSVRRTHSLGLK
jgi:hypothetical protein